ncbi:5'-nucleotidase/2',3'-cyclic phosphodiesterase [Peptoniphilus sp. ING2-D1G]|nr:5'-nucleotidase/2',3'-cyclic phosphodiesterase [Peptoniphilus sp. ING2-D1G]
MKINIFATADIHGRVVPYNYGTNCPTDNSIANLHSAYKALKDENSILVDNGDMIKGNFIEKFVYFHRHPAIEIMNFMEYDLWNLGNHEFNYGLDNIYRLMNDFKGTTLLANSNGNFTPYKIIEKKGIKIAFIGIETLFVNEFEAQQLGDFKITDPVDVLDSIIDEIREDVHAIIGLFHLGLSDENGVVHAGILSIIDSMKHKKYLDAIISGHTHDGFESFKYKDILIAQPPAYGRGLIKLELDFSEKKLNRINSKIIKSSDYEPDEDIIDIYEPYHKKILEFTNKILGFVDNVEGDYNYDLEDGPLVHLITDVMRFYYPADVVAFQLDSPDTKMKNGFLRRTDIARFYTYSGGEVSLYEITGSDLKEYMNWSSRYYIYEDGELKKNPKRQSFKYKTFDIFGNIKYILDYRKEDRITCLKRLDGSDILDEDKLIIGMNEYRMNYLMSDMGPLKYKNFQQISSSQYIQKGFENYGTIRELAEIFFDGLPENKFVYNGKTNFEIKY